MSDERALYRLLFRGLLDIRIDAYERSDWRTFHIADLLHNLPLELELLARGEADAAQVLTDLRARAEMKGSLHWLDHALKEEAQAEPELTEHKKAS